MKEVKIKTGFSQKKNEFEAVGEVFEKIKQEKMKLVIMFADGGYNQSKINEAWRKKIPPETAFLGCPSLKITVPFYKIGENITPQGFKECLTAMSIASDKIEVVVKLIRNIKNNWEKTSSQALIEGAKALNLDLKNVDTERYFGLLFCDTMSAREDYILENFYAMSNLLFVGGGSIGKMDIASWLFKGVGGPAGCVHTKEGAFTDSAAIALVKCDVPFKIDFTTSLYPTQTKFKVTKVSEKYMGKMKMWSIDEFDGKPALEEYIKALGVSKLALGLERLPNLRFFAAHPLGLMIKDRAYIRFIGTRKGKSLLMASPVKEGQALYLMKRGDIIKTTQQTMIGLKEKLGSISGMILFQCGLRKLEADTFKVSDDLFKVMNIAPLIGLCTFREYYGWLSMEQSFSILAIGDC